MQMLHRSGEVRAEETSEQAYQRLLAEMQSHAEQAGQHFIGDVESRMDQSLAGDSYLYLWVEVGPVR